MEMDTYNMDMGHTIYTHNSMVDNQDKNMDNHNNIETYNNCFLNTSFILYILYP